MELVVCRRLTSANGVLDPSVPSSIELGTAEHRGLMWLQQPSIWKSRYQNRILGFSTGVCHHFLSMACVRIVSTSRTFLVVTKIEAATVAAERTTPADGTNLWSAPG